MKGSSATVGALRLSAVAAALEHAARNQDAASLPGYMEKLEKQVEAVRETLHEKNLCNG